ncbi:hypothetical protein G9A89_016355 [Geosiphon pyriformis]|nr:hypothetical protein G9A89_016355 [Geosiphon pyriformis]
MIRWQKECKKNEQLNTEESARTSKIPRLKSGQRQHITSDDALEKFSTPRRCYLGRKKDIIHSDNKDNRVLWPLHF